MEPVVDGHSGARGHIPRSVQRPTACACWHAPCWFRVLGVEVPPTISHTSSLRSDVQPFLLLWFSVRRGNILSQDLHLMLVTRQRLPFSRDTACPQYSIQMKGTIENLRQDPDPCSQVRVTSH